MSLINTKKLTLKEISGRLHALNPVSVLDRGYSITRTLPDKTIISDADTVSDGQSIEILLAKGSIRCRVEKDKTNGKKENI